MISRAVRASRGSASAVVAVAFVVRLVLVLASGGLGGNTGYDPGVYYSAAASLTSGRLPYADFDLIHPPGIALLLAPFALVGRFTTDHLGFMTAVVASMAVGAVNALLVHVIARRAGFGVRAATLGGLFYAVSTASAGAEFTARLEPFGNLFVLLAVLSYVSYGPRWCGRASLLCGVASGAAISVKIWFVVLLLVLILATAWGGRGRRQVALTVIGAVGAAILVNGPFFLAAPADMWRSVIVEQLARAPFATSPRTRLRGMTGLADVALPGVLLTVALVAAVAMAALLSWRAVRLPVGRVAVALLVAESLTLLLSPSWFAFYADFVLVGASLTVAAAAAPVPGRSGGAVGARLDRRWLVPLVAVSATALVTAGVEVVRPVHASRAFPAAALRPLVVGARCVRSDSPMALIQLNVLTRDLDRGCAPWVDVTGRTYGVDLDRRPDGSPVARGDNRVWQQDLQRYFAGADAVVIADAGRTGISAATLRSVTAGRVLHQIGHIRVYVRMRPSSRDRS